MKAARMLRFGPPNVITNDDVAQPDSTVRHLVCDVDSGSDGD
jgi:hypothetical protein